MDFGESGFSPLSPILNTMYCETIRTDCPFPAERKPDCTYAGCVLQRVYTRLGLDLNPHAMDRAFRDRDRDKPIIAMPTHLNPVKL
jgi:hypothetical protein